MINILIYFEEDIVILAVVIGLILLAVLRFRLKASNIHIFFFSMFYIYICLLIKYTQFPIEYLPELVNRSMVFDSVNYIPFSNLDLKNSILNLILTIPFGFLLSFVIKISTKKILIWSIVLPIILEGSQLTIGLVLGQTLRIIDVNDIVFNYIGVLIGYAIFKFFVLFARKITDDQSTKNNAMITYVRQL